jgi:hypothetical protein
MSKLRLPWILWLAAAAITLFFIATGIRPLFNLLGAVCEASAETCATEGLISRQDLPAFESAKLSLEFYAYFNIAFELVATAVWFAVSLVVFIRKSNDRMALWVSMFLLVFPVATFSSAFLDAAVSARPALWLPAQALKFLGEILAMGFFFLFPSGQFVPRWARWPALLYAVLHFGQYFFPATVFDYNTWLDESNLPFVVYLASLLLAQLYRYRRVSGPTQRYQTRWVVSGLTAALVGVILLWQIVVWSNLFGTLAGFILSSATDLLMLLIPISIGVAILRYRLFDIDVIIRKTLQYGLLSGILVLLYFGSVLLFQSIFRSMTGLTDELAIVVSTLGIAVLFNPLRTRLQILIDRKFFRQKYDAVQALAAFGATLRDEVDLSVLSQRLVEVVAVMIQPQTISLWLREPMLQEKPDKRLPEEEFKIHSPPLPQGQDDLSSG